MAITTIYTYPLDGSQREFTIPFEYLARRFVVLTLIGTDRRELELTTDYRFISKTAVQTTVAWGPGDGYERIEVRRNTSATERLVDFADGSILRASELNTSQVQTLHVAEEARNMVADTISTNQDGDLDARGRRLVNLADATEPGHAVTLRQEQEWAQSTLGNRNAAEAARVAADLARDVSVTNRNQAGAFRDQAESAKATAETARDQSVAAANTIGNNVTLAQQARAGAESARDVTVASAQSVQGVNIPSAIGNGLKWLRQKANEMGFEYVEAYTKQAVDSLLAPLLARKNPKEFVHTLALVSGATSFSNTLGVIPSWVTVYYVCKEADAGYVPGDLVHVSPYQHDGAGTLNRGFAFRSVTADLIEVWVMGTGMVVIHKTTNQPTTLAPARWDAVIRLGALI